MKMTAKEYLMQYRNLDALIDAKLDRIMRLRALAEKRTTIFSDMPRSGQRSDRYDIVARIVDMERELDAEIDRLLTLHDEIKATISAVSDENYRTLLELRYLTRMTWEQIARKMYFGREWVIRLHGHALLDVKVP